MLNEYAVLSDFADDFLLEYEIHESQLVEDASTANIGDSIAECVLTWERGSQTVSMALINRMQDPKFNIANLYDFTRDLRIRACIGYTRHAEEFLGQFQDHKASRANFVGDEELGLVSVELAESSHDITYVTLELFRPLVYIGNHHMERLGFFMARFELLAKELHAACFHLEDWLEPSGLQLQRLIEQALERVDRIFLTNQGIFRESDLEEIHWPAIAKRSDDYSALPHDYLETEFTEAAFWDGSAVVENLELLELIWASVIEQLDLIADSYSKEIDQVWVLRHELFTKERILMSIHANLTLGAKALRKIREGAKPI